MIKIEDVLDLSNEEIEHRISEERRKFPKHAGINYLEQRIARFRTPEGNVFYYLARHNPSLFNEVLNQYSSYSGNTSRMSIIEVLRERYILEKLQGKIKHQR